MSNTSNSFSSLIGKFTSLQNNSLEIIQGLSKATSTDSDFVTISYKNLDGEDAYYTIPSIGYLEDKINRIDTTITKLVGLDGTDANIRMSDGTYSKIFTSNILNSPDKISGLSVPQKFSYRNNWFFESFLSPALYVPFDITNHVNLNSNKILIKRIIINTTNDSQKFIFDDNFKNRNNISYEKLISILQSNDILFFVDEEIQDLPLSILRYDGSFDVLRFEDVDITDVNGNELKRRKYFLNKLTYTDNLVNARDSVDLKINDKLVIGQTIFIIESIDSTFNSITVKRVPNSGYDSIQIGADTLRLYSDKFSIKQAKVGVGFDERQVVFFKAVDPNFNLVSTTWSDGVGFYSNDLLVETSRGTQSLANFYKSQVIDFGQQFISAAKEKTIPAIYGEIPNAPIINDNDLKVVRINNHKLNSADIEDIKKKASDKVRLNSEINELISAIDDKKNELVNKKFNTDNEKRGIKNELDSLIREKTSKSNLYASIIQELALISQDKPSVLDKPKYRIRGFFEIPKPVSNEKTGLQYPIQFEIEYRYLRLDGSGTGSEYFEYKDAQGITIRGTYSNWVKLKSDIRKKIYNDASGTYSWLNDDIENPNIVNINQIDIPITKGEKVEVRVRTISEAGWPVNPLMSEYSEGVIINFPDEFNTEDSASIAIQNALDESNRVKFQQELDSKNLDLHLSRSFTTGENYFSHDADEIASGYYTNEGNVINLFQKLKEMESTIASLKAKVEMIKGKISVKIKDPSGNIINVKNGDVVNLFSGYYEDVIAELPINDRKGAIITTVYKLIIENSENSPLELLSLLPGGIGERLPNTYEGHIIEQNDRDYNISRRYDNVPIVNTSIDKSETNTASKISSAFYQSQQLLSQFIYSRYTDIGLSPKNSLYLEGFDNNGIHDKNYKPQNRMYYANPPSSAGSQHAFVWNGEYSDNIPNGGGSLTDFCVHVNHPKLNDGYQRSFLSLQYPSIELNGSLIDSDFSTLPIPITNDDEGTSEFCISKYATLAKGGTYIGTQNKISEIHSRAQLNYRNNWNETDWSFLNGDYNKIIDADDYSGKYITPDKFGFTDNDR